MLVPPYFIIHSFEWKKINNVLIQDLATFSVKSQINIFSLHAIYDVYLILFFVNFYTPFTIYTPFFARAKERPPVESDHKL